jgi:putative YhbY family RNA-binding protein
MPAMSSARRSELRAQAHGLSPVVIIGDKGLSASVVAEIDRALKAHELIKVKAATDDREMRAAWMAELCEKLEAHAVQSIGKVLVLWREDPDKAKKKEAAAKPVPKAAPKKRPHTSGGQAKRKHRTAEELIRIVRQRSPAPSPRPESGPRRRRPRTSR